jgi:hypothetical protein
VVTSETGWFDKGLAAMVKKAGKLNLVHITAWVSLLSLCPLADAAQKYYDRKEDRSTALQQAEADESLYRDAIDEQVVEIVPVSYSQRKVSKMQPHYHHHWQNQGIYFGASAGLDVGDTKFTSQNESHSYGAQGLIGRIFAGYQWFVNEQFFISGEVSGEYTTAENSDAFKPVSDAKWQQKNYRTMGGDLGIVAGSLLPSFDTAWLKLGISMSKLSHESKPDSEDFVAASFDKHLIGFVGELGVEAYFTPQMFLRYAYGYRYYPQHEGKLENYENTGTAGKLGFTASSAQSTLGVGYYLSEHKGYRYFASTVAMQGFYAGAFFGQDHLIMAAEHSDASAVKYEFKSNNSSLLAGLYGGYFYPLSNLKSHTFKNFGIGLDAFLQMTSPGADYQDQNSARTVESIGAGLMFAYQLVNNNHVYLRVGTGYNHLTTAKPKTGNKHPKASQGKEWAQRKTPLLMGLGYETMLTEHFAVRAETDVGLYGAEETKTDTIKHKHTPTVYTYRLGVSYRFG